jgi:excisionase family DNA binding protein
MGKELTKEQAAKRLKISVRSLQRAASAGKVKPVYHRGASGKMETFFDSDDLDRYKEELAQVVEPERKPALFAAPTGDSRALSQIGAGSYVADLHDLLERLVATQERQLPPVPPAPVSDSHTLSQAAPLSIADKIMLTLPEASALTNLSRNHLRQAIEEKKLKARIIGRGWRVKRDDLGAYVKKL